MQKPTGNVRYDENIARLTDRIYKNELERRKWADEKWIHSNGRLIRLAKPSSYILSCYTFLVSVLFCLILGQRIFMFTTDKQNAELSAIPFMIAMVMAMCVLLIIGNFFMTRKQYLPSMLLTGISSLMVGTLFASQLSAEFSNNNYLVFYSINIALCLCLAASVLSVYFVMRHERRELGRLLDNTLNRLARENKDASLLSLDEYSDLIEAFLEKGKKTK